MADICLMCAKNHIDVLDIGDTIVGFHKCSNCKGDASKQEGVKDGN